MSLGLIALTLVLAYQAKLVTAGSSITPLSQALSVFPSTMTRSEQTSVLQLLFDLPVGYDLDTYDPMRALLTNQPGSVAALSGILKLATLWDSVYNPSTQGRPMLRQMQPAVEPLQP